MNEQASAILARAKELEPDTARILGDLVRVPSFSTKEREVVEVIRAEMQRVGFDEIRIDGLGSIVGRIGDGPRVLAFDAHIDTVYPGDLDLWQFDPFSGDVVEGRVRGRGTVDQKGGMASMLAAARIIREMDLARGLTIWFTGTVLEEDCDGLCWLHLVREEGLRPELVVITEPTNLNLYRGQRGRMEITIRARGLSCHGSAPERGDNAVYKTARIALEIEKLNERLPDDPFLGKGSVAVTQFFFTSPSQCAVPDSATLQLDRRLTRGETKETALAEAREAARAAGVPEAEVKLLVYEEAAYTGKRYPMEKYYPTWVLEEDSPHLAAAVESYRRVLGREPLVDKWTFSTNGIAISGFCGIPCLGLGPGDERLAHAPNEACPVAHLGEASAFYAGLAAHWSGTFA
jgi:putative selenium metabolism hydrolase